MKDQVSKIQKLINERAKEKLLKDIKKIHDVNISLKMNPVYPTEGSKMHKLYGGKSEKTKEKRSVTPMGFAYAFFEANKNYSYLQSVNN